MELLIMPVLDLSKCKAPMDVTQSLKLAAVHFRNLGTINYDYQQAIDGNPWWVIADEIERIANVIDSRLLARSSSPAKRTTP